MIKTLALSFADAAEPLIFHVHSKLTDGRQWHHVPRPALCLLSRAAHLCVPMGTEHLRLVAALAGLGDSPCL